VLGWGGSNLSRGAAQCGELLACRPSSSSSLAAVPALDTHSKGRRTKVRNSRERESACLSGDGRDFTHGVRWWQQEERLTQRASGAARSRGGRTDHGSVDESSQTGLGAEREPHGDASPELNTTTRRRHQPCSSSAPALTLTPHSVLYICALCQPLSSSFSASLTHRRHVPHFRHSSRPSACAQVRKSSNQWQGSRDQQEQKQPRVL
jgi:hypothetical protein